MPYSIKLICVLSALNVNKATGFEGMKLVLLSSVIIMNTVHLAALFNVSVVFLLILIYPVHK